MLIWFLAGSAAMAAPLKVVATFSVLGDITSQIGGAAVQVTSLVGPGGDAHVFEPTPRDAKTLAAADLVVVNGMGLEGWLDRLIAVSGYKGPVAVASQGVPPLSPGGDQTAVDPHAWQNLANGRIYVANIAAALDRAAPADAPQFDRQARRFEAEIDDLDAWVRQQIAQVPRAKRKIITSHDSFGYFGAAYGVTFLAPVGLSTEGEPTAAGFGRLVKQIRSEGIKALFIESMTDPRLVQQLARETGAVCDGPLYADTLSPAGGPADSYLAMFRHNVPAMVAAMQKN
jgi:zinc/manganese transport system substrate-binding protein